MRVEPSEMGSVLLQKDHGALPHFPLWGPHGPDPDPDPEPNHTWPSASRIIYCLLTPWLWSFFYSNPKGPRPSPHSTPMKQFLCVCVVFCTCAVYVFSVCVFHVYVVCVLC